MKSTENGILRLLWRPGADGGAVLYRVYGTSPVVKVPHRIGGYKVNGIGAYCFSDKKRMPEGIREAVMTPDGSDGQISNGMCELSGSFPEEICLPDTVTKIDNAAFFNCRGLKRLEIGNETLVIGSDVFNNCTQLKTVKVRGSVRDASGIRQVLDRISWDMNAEFADARVLYPEYYESYDTIAPAHIFGLNIEGEGFRARQCFRKDVVDFPAYDEIFTKACAEESVETLSRMSLNRLMAPFDLEEEKRRDYERYIRENAEQIIFQFVDKRERDELEFICRNRYVRAAVVDMAVQRAVSEDWSEGAAELMEWKQRFFAVDKTKRYEF